MSWVFAFSCYLMLFSLALMYDLLLLLDPGLDVLFWFG